VATAGDHQCRGAYRAGHDRRYAVGTDKIRAELGYVPQETFQTGIAKTIKWYLANEAWWRPLQKK